MGKKVEVQEEKHMQKGSGMNRVLEKRVGERNRKGNDAQLSHAGV